MELEPQGFGSSGTGVSRNGVLVSASRPTALETTALQITASSQASHTLSFTKTLSHGPLEKSEVEARGPWLTLSKGKKKVLISWALAGARQAADPASPPHAAELAQEPSHCVPTAACRGQVPQPKPCSTLTLACRPL